MHRLETIWKQFNWRMLLMRILVNMVALSITALVVPKIYFVDRTVWSWLLVAVTLGIVNALVKPLIQVLTLRFIFATYGVVVVLINTIILLLLALLLPRRFAVDSILWALVGGAVIGIVSALLENLLGLTPPIVSEKYPTIRQRIKDRASHRLETRVTQAAAEKALKPEDGTPQAPSPADDAAAVLALVDNSSGTPALGGEDTWKVAGVAETPGSPVATEVAGTASTEQNETDEAGTAGQPAGPAADVTGADTMGNVEEA